VLSEINTKLSKIMANVQELSDAVDALQVTVDNIQSVVLAKIAELEALNADLSAQLANGATPEQVQVIFDKIAVISADLATTLPA
jgi:outer membrane murein-binding lipoprotein Lpp